MVLWFEINDVTTEDSRRKEKWRKIVWPNFTAQSPVQSTATSSSSSSPSTVGPATEDMALAYVDMSSVIEVQVFIVADSRSAFVKLSFPYARIYQPNAMMITLIKTSTIFVVVPKTSNSRKDCPFERRRRRPRQEVSGLSHKQVTPIYGPFNAISNRDRADGQIFTAHPFNFPCPDKT